jgi:hypothetical protein
MTRQRLVLRQQRIDAGRCPRCNKPVHEWPLQRADVCHMPGAVSCARLWSNIYKAELRLKVTS